MNELTIECKHHYIIINGKYYEPTFDKMKKPILKEIPDAEKRISKAKEMAKILEESLDKEKVLTEAVMKLDDKEFDNLYKSLKSGRKYKPKTREGHCVDMRIGNFVLPIVG